MKQTRPNKPYRLEDLVMAADTAAREATSDPVLANIVVTKVLEDWFKKSGRMDLVAKLETALA
jgi:hypothetical protein